MADILKSHSIDPTQPMQHLRVCVCGHDGDSGSDGKDTETHECRRPISIQQNQLEQTEQELHSSLIFLVLVLLFDDVVMMSLCLNQWEKLFARGLIFVRDCFSVYFVVKNQK